MFMDNIFASGTQKPPHDSNFTEPLFQFGIETAINAKTGH